MVPVHYFKKIKARTQATSQITSTVKNREKQMYPCRQVHTSSSFLLQLRNYCLEKDATPNGLHLLVSINIQDFCPQARPQLLSQVKLSARVFLGCGTWTFKTIIDSKDGAQKTWSPRNFSTIPIPSNDKRASFLPGEPGCLQNVPFFSLSWRCQVFFMKLYTLFEFSNFTPPPCLLLTVLRVWKVAYRQNKVEISKELFKKRGLTHKYYDLS